MPVCHRDIKERGDAEAGLRFEEDLLDAEAVGLRRAEDLRVERRAFGQRADQREQLGADLRLAGLRPAARVLMVATVARRSAVYFAAMSLRESVS